MKHISSYKTSKHLIMYSKAGVSSLWDLMPDGLRWSLCHDRNKVHNKCNVLESSPNHPPANLPESVEKSSSMKPVPVPTMLGTTALNHTSPFEMAR